MSCLVSKDLDILHIGIRIDLFLVIVSGGPRSAFICYKKGHRFKKRDKL